MVPHLFSQHLLFNDLLILGLLSARQSTEQKIFLTT